MLQFLFKSIYCTLSLNYPESRLKVIFYNHYTIINLRIEEVMKFRYFSPKLRDQLGISKDKYLSKLREVGSTSKLLSLNNIDDEVQIKVGEYTYQKNKEIGSGYSSKVYKGKKRGQSLDYAIKVIDLKNYKNQIQILKSVEHPNIIKCYDIIKTRLKCYIITEYCPHGDLLAYISKKGKLSEKQASEIISQIIEGTKYLIENNIIHRDLKPANVIKSGLIWKIADFGFAIKSNKEFKSKANVGTPLYMPPQSLIDNIYSFKSDIFAIGIIFYELIIGCTPWQSKTQRDLIKKITTYPFRISDKLKITERTRNLLHAMCETKQKNRMDKNQFVGFHLNQLTSIQNPEDKKQSKYEQLAKIDKKSKRSNHKSLQIKIERLSQLTKIRQEGIREQKNIIDSSLKYNFSSQIIPQTRQIKNSVGMIIPKKSIRSRQNYIALVKEQKQPGYKLKKLDRQPKIITNNIMDNKSISKSNLYSSIAFINQPSFSIHEQLLNANYIVINQLHYCRFQYYIIKNSNYLVLENKPEVTQKIALILFKHLLKIIKQLSDISKNWLKIPIWDQLIGSKIFANTFNTIKDYTYRYENQYLLFIKNIDVDIIREVNREFPEFATAKTFTLDFYGKVLKVLGPVIRSNNHRLGLYLTRNQKTSEMLTKEQISQIQALKSILKYYRLVQMSINNFENYSFFEANSSIKVHTDYKKSGCTTNSYLQIRQQIKNI